MLRRGFRLIVGSSSCTSDDSEAGGDPRERWTQPVDFVFRQPHSSARLSRTEPTPPMTETCVSGITRLPQSSNGGTG